MTDGDADGRLLGEREGCEVVGLTEGLRDGLDDGLDDVGELEGKFEGDSVVGGVGECDRHVLFLVSINISVNVQFFCTAF